MWQQAGQREGERERERRRRRRRRKNSLHESTVCVWRWRNCGGGGVGRGGGFCERKGSHPSPRLGSVIFQSPSRGHFSLMLPCYPSGVSRELTGTSL